MLVDGDAKLWSGEIFGEYLQLSRRPTQAPIGLEEEWHGYADSLSTSPGAFLR